MESVKKMRYLAVAALLIILYVSVSAGLSADYRTQMELEHDYPRILASTGTSSFLAFKVINPVSKEKKLNTSVEGLDARIVGSTGDEWYETYELGKEGTRRFQIEIYEDSVGEYNLTIKTENTDYGLQTSEKLLVDIRDIKSSAETREVPGIEIFQILVIVFLSTVLYSASL